MNSETIMKSTSSQTNTTVIFKILALIIGNELNNGTIAPSTRRAFFKIMYNVFLLSSKKIPFEQYCQLYLSEPNVATCETKSNNVFVLSHTSFDENNFYFLHSVQEAVGAFNDVLEYFGFFQRLDPCDPSKHPTQSNPATHTEKFKPGFL